MVQGKLVNNNHTHTHTHQKVEKGGKEERDDWVGKTGRWKERLIEQENPILILNQILKPVLINCPIIIPGTKKKMENKKERK